MSAPSAKSPQTPGNWRPRIHLPHHGPRQYASFITPPVLSQSPADFSPSQCATNMARRGTPTAEAEAEEIKAALEGANCRRRSAAAFDGLAASTVARLSSSKPATIRVSHRQVLPSTRNSRHAARALPVMTSYYDPPPHRQTTIAALIQPNTRSPYWWNRRLAFGSRCQELPIDRGRRSRPELRSC